MVWGDILLSFSPRDDVAHCALKWLADLDCPVVGLGKVGLSVGIG